MRIPKIKTMPRIFLALIVVCVPLAGLAQPGKLELKNLEKLSNKAVEINDVTLDSSLLALAVKVLDMSGDSDAKQVKDAIKGVTGIYVKSFEFDAPNQYDQADVQAIRVQLARPGWSRIVGSVNKRRGAEEHSEIYLLKEGDKVNGLAILVAEAKELTVVNIVGFVDMDKLALLGGKFGIPDDLKDKSNDPTRHKPVSHKSDKSDKQEKSDKSDKKESGHDNLAMDEDE